MVVIFHSLNQGMDLRFIRPEIYKDEDFFRKIQHYKNKIKYKVSIFLPLENKLEHFKVWQYYIIY